VGRGLACVRVLDEEPELLRGVDAEAGARLRRQVTADLVELEAGARLCPATLPRDTFAMVLLDGMLVRHVRLAGRASSELLGAGDVVRPWQDDGSLASLPAETEWRALQPTRAALLDGAFLGMVHRHPSVVAELLARVVHRCHALAARLAIAQMPHLDSRLIALFWHLADRWGRVEPGRVTVPLPLSHAVIADLACAQRPSVSVALKHLIARERLARTSSGWALYGGPPALPLSPAAPAFVVRRHAALST
jgi:CRP/FNR family cyclic AMP-dependent transcriptional regulator